LRKSRAPVWNSKRELEHSRTELARLIEDGFSNNYLLLGLSRLVTSLLDFEKAVDESDGKCADAIEASYSCITAQRSAITSQTEDEAKVQQTRQAPTKHTTGYQETPPTRASKEVSFVSGKEWIEQAGAEDRLASMGPTPFRPPWQQRTSSKGSNVSSKSLAGDSVREPLPGETLAAEEGKKASHKTLQLTRKQVDGREE
jgi:hypothetical protein